MMQALAVGLSFQRFAADINQAYLHSEMPESEWIPVRYPEGPVRDKHRDPTTGEERYAILRGNLYGNPTAARAWQRTLFDWIESLNNKISPNLSIKPDTASLAAQPSVAGNAESAYTTPTAERNDNITWRVRRMMYEPCKGNFLIGNLCWLSKFLTGAESFGINHSIHSTLPFVGRMESVPVVH